MGKSEYTTRDSEREPRDEINREYKREGEKNDIESAHRECTEMK